MNSFIRLLAFFIQKILLRISFYFSLLFTKRNNEPKIVIGVIEIASYLYNISQILENSYSVNLFPNKFYKDNKEFIYSFEIKLNKYKRLILGPILLGYLLNISNTFIYLGDKGFLINPDGRKFEFSYLKIKNKKIINIFLGSEIRSPALMKTAYKNTETISTYLQYYNIDHIKREQEIKMTAEVSEQYSTIILNDDYDQKSYFNKKNKPIFYFIPKNVQPINFNKFNRIDSKKIVILHAPSNPYIKGTQVVRAAIKSLKSKGYNIRYIELINRKHSDVMKIFSRVHIVVNELYSFTLGVFAIEAMSNYCAVLTSADTEVNKSLPKSKKNGWMRTRSWELYDNLEFVISDRKKIIEIADAGLKYVNKNFNDDVNKRIMNEYISTRTN